MFKVYKLAYREYCYKLKSYDNNYMSMQSWEPTQAFSLCIPVYLAKVEMFVVFGLSSIRVPIVNFIVNTVARDPA